MSATSSTIEAPTMTEEEFSLFSQLIHQVAGIQLSEARKAFLIGRVAARLRAHRLATFTDYYTYLVEGTEPLERDRFFDCICSNETAFFREPRQFELLENEILPAWKLEAENGARPARVRAWSAGCSSGEEPYSLGMQLLEHCNPDAGWDLQVLASDISTRALARAQAGLYHGDDAADIPENYLARYMVTEDERFKPGPELKELMEFRRINLNSDSYGFTGEFDLIFCRNVLMYFDHCCRVGVINRLVQSLAPGGYLFVGYSETLPAVEGMTEVIPTVFRSTQVSRKAEPAA